VRRLRTVPKGCAPAPTHAERLGAGFDGRVVVDKFSFMPGLVSIPRGAALEWDFRDDYIHDATVVRGPRGFATATVRDRKQRHRFTVPGEYRIYCSIHPVLMSQVVKVRQKEGI
jgi:plastocyanin